jgi:hypothetical protein
MRAPSYVKRFVPPTRRESLNRSQMPVSRKIYRLAPKTGYSIAADPLKKTSPRGLLYFALSTGVPLG